MTPVVRLNICDMSGSGADQSTVLKGSEGRLVRSKLMVTTRSLPLMGSREGEGGGGGGGLGGGGGMRGSRKLMESAAGRRKAVGRGEGVRGCAAM